MRPHLNVGVVSSPTPEDAITSVVGHAGLAQELVVSIRAGLAESTISGDRDALVGNRFFAAVDAVTLDVDSDPRGNLLKSLIKEDWDRTDAEVVKCLRFIYFHMVNKFKGDLAEFLAVPICRELEREWKRDGRLPPEAHFVWGSDLREPLGTDLDAGRRRSWHKGADGLFVVEETQEIGKIGPGSDLTVFGVVEVKSYRLSYRRAAPQIDHNLARLREGLKVRERKWSPDRLWFGKWDTRHRSWSQTPVTATTHPKVLRLLVIPGQVEGPSTPGWRELSRDIFLATLPHTSDFLAAAAYDMTVWFIEQLGCRVFKELPSPWPEFTPEEAGFNAVKQALYYILLRNLPERAERIATRLYNVYGFGYDVAKGYRDMIWSDRGKLVSDWQEPEPTTEVPAGLGLEQVVDRAWSFYRRCYMDEAMAYINAALAMGPDEEMTHRLKWLRGMIHYFRTEFERAAREFPSPRPEPQDRWAKDKLTMARIFARLDRLDEAVQEIQDVSAAQLQASFVPISVSVCEAMVAMKQGQNDEAQRSLNAALRALQARQAEIDTREAHGLGVYQPWSLDAYAIVAIIIDTVPISVSLGGQTTAMELLTHVRSVFPPYLLLMTLDPLLEPLRRDPELGPRFLAWLKERHKEAGLEAGFT